MTKEEFNSICYSILDSQEFYSDESLFEFKASNKSQKFFVIYNNGSMLLDDFLELLFDKLFNE